MTTERSHTLACFAALLLCSCQSEGEKSGPSTTQTSAPSKPASTSEPVAAVTPSMTTTPTSPSVTIKPTSASAGAPAAMSGSPAANSSNTAGAAGMPVPAAAGSSGMTDIASTPSSLPEVSDFKAAGPFTPKSEPGDSGYVLFYPQELGKDGIKHPIVSWGPGAAETAADFTTLLNHLASHGFAIVSFDGTPQGQELVTGIDWMLAQNTKEGSTFYQKLDETKISAGGHSAGSLGTFVIGGDKRLVTTMHISGGTFDPHTDIMNLHAPALFVCGESGGDGLLQGDVASPNCEIDFNNAMVPVFYGVTKGAAHMTPTEIGDPAIRTHQLGAMVGWLRWQLVGDANAKSMFVGDSCGLCMDAAWSTAKQKNLN